MKNIWIISIMSSLVLMHTGCSVDSTTDENNSSITEDSYIYPPDTKLTAIAVEPLARPSKTAFQDRSKASVKDPAFGTTITRMHVNGPNGYSGFLYPKSQFWNADMSLIYLGYRFFNAHTLEESPITKNLNTGKSFAKLGNPIGNTFKWSHINPHVFYTLQGENKLTFTKNTINGTEIEHEVIFDFQKYDYEKILLGNGEGHIDRYDKHVIFVAKKPDNDHIFALLCNIQKPEDACKIKEIEDSTWGTVFIGSENGGYGERALYDWIDISPNGDYIIENKTVGGAQYIGQHLDKVPTAIFKYDLNFENQQKLTDLAGHGDMGLDKDGHQVYVQFEYTKGGIISYDLDAPQEERETKLLSSTYGGGHVSCQNYNRPGWCYLSTADKHYNEVFAVKLDGSETVNRFVQARSIAGPYAGVSPDGKRVVFLSNWDDNKSIYTMYHAGLKK